MKKIIKGRFKNNGEYKEDDKYTPILNNGAVVGFIESVEKENVNIILWERYISKEYLYGLEEKIFVQFLFVKSLFSISDLQKCLLEVIKNDI